MTVPAYISRPRLLAELDICDRTLDAWLKKGFPKSKKHAGTEPRWKWKEVERWMDGEVNAVQAAAAADDDAALREMIDNGHNAHLAQH